MRAATLVHVDKMRTLLELHYDNVVVERCKERGSKSKQKPNSQHEVFQSVVQGCRRQLRQRIELTAKVKQIFRRPADEAAWAAIDRLREVVLDELQGRADIELETAEDKEDLASAVQRSSDVEYYDSIAERT